MVTPVRGPPRRARGSRFGGNRSIPSSVGKHRARVPDGRTAGRRLRPKGKSKITAVGNATRVSGTKPIVITELGPRNHELCSRFSPSPVSMKSNHYRWQTRRRTLPEKGNCLGKNRSPCGRGRSMYTGAIPVVPGLWAGISCCCIFFDLPKSANTPEI